MGLNLNAILSIVYNLVNTFNEENIKISFKKYAKN
jgi:hypothetical protein